MYKHSQKIITSGKDVEEAEKAVIMLHGRGANPQDILILSDYLNIKNFALFAPAATNNSWYPFSFMAPRSQNEPALSSALEIINNLCSNIEAKGISASNIFILGFSQGACLSLEYAAQNAKKYAGIIAFTGGLIGDKIDKNLYNGNFSGTTVFIGSGDNDPHVPLNRIKESVVLLKEMNASVTEKIYPNLPHTIIKEEIDLVNKIFFDYNSN